MNNHYRPDIDGFRAIAVLSVVFFHSNIKPFDIDFFSGGYLGVDIFFVISGYLISGIIFKELKKSEKKFRYLDFYERRARRILPALFFIILISIPLAYNILLPQHLLDFAKSILSAVYFFSNFHFIASDYYDVEAILKPLLHTWSLSVEEQFYIFFPFFLVFLFKNYKKYLLNIFIFFILVSLVSAQILGSYDPSTNFYILTSRIWELFCGAAISILQISGKKKKFKNYNFGNFYSIFGFTLILASVFLFSSQTHHPSFLTAIPIVGTILVIYFSDKNYFITKILSNKILVKIGLVSYSFYLWHFVIFSLAKHASLYHDKVSKKYILLCLALSFFSYYIIEKPFRNKKVISPKILILTLSCLLALLTSLSLYLIRTYDNTNEQLKVINNYIFTQIPKKIFVNDKACFAAKDFCEYTSTENNKFAFIVGDSVMEGLAAGLTSKLIDSGYNVILMNNSLCHFIPEFNSVVGDRQRVVSNQICDHEYQNLRLDKILNKPESIIILGGLLPFENFKHHKNNKITFEYNYKKFINKLLNKNYKIVQLTDILIYKEKISELIQKKSFKENFIQENKNVRFDFILNINQNEFLKKNKRRLKLFNSMNHKNYMKVSNQEIFCNTKLKNKCVFNDDKDLFIHDHYHYSKKGSELINNKIIYLIKNHR
jgi:peptidoglycan/LPS O-acetylase OafA/YrhL